jgi:hypothetical protein
MRTLLIALFVFGGLTLTSCKKDELATEKYAGVWNYETSQGCQSTLTIQAVDDNNITITYPIKCFYAATIKATVAGNQIAIPLQNTPNSSSHQANGTITENSIQFGAYRYSGNGGYWVMKLTASK